MLLSLMELLNPDTLQLLQPGGIVSLAGRRRACTRPRAAKNRLIHGRTQALEKTDQVSRVDLRFSRSYCWRTKLRAMPLVLCHRLFGPYRTVQSGAEITAKVQRYEYPGVRRQDMASNIFIRGYKEITSYPVSRETGLV